MTEEEKNQFNQLNVARKELSENNKQLEKSVEDLNERLAKAKNIISKRRKGWLTSALYFNGRVIKSLFKLGTLVLGAVTLFELYLFKKQTDLFENQNKIAYEQTYLQEAERRSALMFLMGNIFDEVNNELQEDYNKDNTRNLSPQLVGRIVAFSHSLAPYKFFVNGQLTKKEYSPERGQLLLTLVNSNIDTTTLDEIYKKANFSHTYLVESNLDSAYLKLANLKDADLSFSEIKYAKLHNTDLRGSNLYEVNFQESHLSGAKLFEANLVKSELKGTNLRLTDLRHTNIDSATLAKNTLLDSSLISKTTKRGDASRWEDYKQINLNDSVFLLVEIKK